MRNNRNSTPEKTEKKKKIEKKSDIVHIVLFLLLLLYTFYSIVGQGGIHIDTFWTDLGSRLASITKTVVFDLVGSISFLLFGITGLYEFVYSRGLIKLLPSYYVKMKEFQHLISGLESKISVFKNGQNAYIRNDATKQHYLSF